MLQPEAQSIEINYDNSNNNTIIHAEKQKGCFRCIYEILFRVVNTKIDDIEKNIKDEHDEVFNNVDRNVFNVSLVCYNNDFAKSFLCALSMTSIKEFKFFGKVTSRLEIEYENKIKFVIWYIPKPENSNIRKSCNLDIVIGNYEEKIILPKTVLLSFKQMNTEKSDYDLDLDKLREKVKEISEIELNDEIIERVKKDERYDEENICYRIFGLLK